MDVPPDHRTSDRPKASGIDLDAILALDIDQRIELAAAIWDSIAAENPPPPLTEADRSELRRRMAEHARDPSTAIPFDEALRCLRERYG
jgi:putative addiction module component (TIGR02574 family)